MEMRGEGGKGAERGRGKKGERSWEDRKARVIKRRE
jgi:hypothetical protein